MREPKYLFGIHLIFCVAKVSTILEITTILDLTEPLPPVIPGFYCNSTGGCSIAQILSFLYSKSPLKNCVKKDENLIQFLVFNDLSNKTASKPIILNDSKSVEDSGLIKNSPLKLLCHGFATNASESSVNQIKNAYVEAQTRANIMMVDYGALGNPQFPYFGDVDLLICYFEAVQNVDKVAKRIAEMIRYLIDLGYTALNLVHLIGHSLGCHVVGGAGNYLQIFYDGQKPARITVLDCACPGFHPINVARPMSETDADFTDAIHTSALLGCFGNVAFLDFYLNFPFLPAPSCWSFKSPDESIQTLIDLLSLGIWCSHGAACYIFALSISTNIICHHFLTGEANFIGEPCGQVTKPGTYLCKELFLSGIISPVV